MMFKLIGSKLTKNYSYRIENSETNEMQKIVN